jgi:glycosyltransferase involved in cell wall biosynthesis
MVRSAPAVVTEIKHGGARASSFLSNIAGVSRSAVVIVPSTGAPELRSCVASVLGQTYPETHAYLVCDGPQFLEAVSEAIAGLGSPRLRLLALPENVGAGGFYGHRIFAAASHLVNQDYLLFLDEDNWFEPEHVATMVELLETRNLMWCYSLRRIFDKQGSFVANDDCESLGKWPACTGINHVDTSAYCLRREVAVAVASAWHGRWGQDRTFYAVLHQHFPRYECTGRYSVNYRLGGNPGSVTAEFFIEGNAAMARTRQGDYPWRRQA